MKVLSTLDNPLGFQLQIKIVIVNVLKSVLNLGILQTSFGLRKKQHYPTMPAHEYNIFDTKFNQNLNSITVAQNKYYYLAILA